MNSWVSGRARRDGLRALVCGLKGVLGWRRNVCTPFARTQKMTAAF